MNGNPVYRLGPRKESYISVIVPTIGRPQSLERLLCSLARQTRLPEEIVVADASSNDHVRELLDCGRWAKLGLVLRRIVVYPPNAVSQRRVAISHAQGNLLLLLDDDVELEIDCIRCLLDTIVSDDTVVAVTADFNNQSWSQPTRLWHFYLRYICRLSEGEWQGRVIGPLLRFGYTPSPIRNAPMQWLGAGTSLIKRDAYEQAGGFSEFFLHRCTMNEDVDLGLKLSKIGQILLCPEARLSHFHAPGGRVSASVASEDDLYNRYLILRLTQRRSATSSFALVFTFFLVETAGNLVASMRNMRDNGTTARLTGRIRAFYKIVFRSKVLNDTRYR